MHIGLELLLAVRRAKHDSQFLMWLARIRNIAETSTNATRIKLCKGVSILQAM